MGRSAKTQEQHWLQGTVTQSADKPSTFAGGRPAYPAHLSPIGRREYKRVIALLEARGTVTPQDYAVLAVFAEVYARWQEVKLQLGTEIMVNEIRTDSNGQPFMVKRVNPLLKVLSDLENRLLSLAKSMGLTAASREKTKRTAQNPKDVVQPGSIAHLMPDWQTLGNVVPIAPPTQFEPEEGDDIESAD